MSYRAFPVTKPATLRFIIGNGGYEVDLIHIKPPGFDRVLCAMEHADVELAEVSAFVTSAMGATCPECRMHMKRSGNMIALADQRELRKAIGEVVHEFMTHTQGGTE